MLICTLPVLLGSIDAVLMADCCLGCIAVVFQLQGLDTTE